MLLCTFQAYWVEQNRGKEKDIRKLWGYADYPDGVVWLCPFDTLENAVVSNLLSAPRWPQEFLVYDVPEGMYLRVDKQKWYAEGNQREDREKLRLHDFEAVPDLDNCMCEFVVDEKMLTLTSDHEINPLAEDAIMPLRLDMTRILGANLLSDTHCPFGIDISGETPNKEDETWSELYNDFLYHNFTQYKLAYFKDSRLLEALNRSAGSEFKGIINLDKHLYVAFALPFAWHMLNSKSNNVSIYDFMPACFSCNELQDIYANRFYPWQDVRMSDFSKDELQSIVNDMKALILPGDIIKPVAENGFPERNEPCFCGSGKKYKKCHGRYFG